MNKLFIISDQYQYHVRSDASTCFRSLRSGCLPSPKQIRRRFTFPLKIALFHGKKKNWTTILFFSLNAMRQSVFILSLVFARKLMVLCVGALYLMNGKPTTGGYGMFGSKVDGVGSWVCWRVYGIQVW